MTAEQNKYFKLFRYVLIAMIVGTLIFIYSQSMKSPETSKAESDRVGEIIAEIIPPETKPGAFVQANIRKLAHFTEFFILGIEMAVYAIFYANGRGKQLLFLPLGAILALFDESVQIFTERVASVADIWIDIAGYTMAIFFTWGAFLLSKLVFAKIVKNKQKQGS